MQEVSATRAVLPLRVVDVLVDITRIVFRGTQAVCHRRNRLLVSRRFARAIISVLGPPVTYVTHMFSAVAYPSDG